jgi:hypothetical protein
MYPRQKKFYFWYSSSSGPKAGEMRTADGSKVAAADGKT